MLIPQTSRASRVQAVVRSAWRRRLLVLSIEQFALALALIFGGGILMLLFGTQILDWYWLVLLGGVGAAIAAYRIHARVIEPYRVAQVLDRRLALSDSLSTAWFLLSRAEQKDNPAARFQLAHAERVANGLPFTTAFPLTGKRLWAMTGGLAAVCFGLFAVRYLVTDSLSLQRSLIPFHPSEVLERMESALSTANQPQSNLAGRDRRNGPTPPATGAQKDGHDDRLTAEEWKTGKPDGTSASQAATEKSQLQQQGNLPQTGKEDSRESGDSASPSGAGDKTHEQNAGQASSQQASDKNQPANGQQNANGLMDRMKDAFSGLMAKMRPNASQRSQQENARGAEDQKTGNQDSAGKDPNGQGQKDALSQQPSQDQSAEGQAQGETTEKTKAAQGRSSDQSADKKSADAQSGIGRQDGDKNVRESEQLKAMGKLAEIIGKRSANVTGDMMVENPSGKEQLRTEYTQRMGHHADLGGEINRDEIPLMYQKYVQEYMEEVRKPVKGQ